MKVETVVLLVTALVYCYVVRSVSEKYSAFILRTEFTVTIQFNVASHRGAQDRVVSYYDLSHYGHEFW